jgi:formylglycine-generating enzyme required for sulfatase activity
MAQADPLNIAGQLVAEKYRIERLVGEGGFAVVYRAQHTIWNKPVAIKFFNGLSTAPVEQRDSLQQAFIQEGALLTDLSSKTAGIVQARDVGATTTPAGQWMPYLVLEWLDGASLEQVIEQEHARARPPWTVSEVVGFLARVLPSLDVAHARGIAHRDIKPANLFVLGSDSRSAETTIKILDFGVAKMVDNSHLKAALAKTGVGISSFTPQYGAPEQFTRTFGATGPWTDVYAMALVAVELLAGKEALQGDDLVQLGFATANAAQRPTPRSLGIDVPDAIEAVFQIALAVDPRQRYQSAAQFLEATLAAIGQRRSRAPDAGPASMAETLPILSAPTPLRESVPHSAPVPEFAARSRTGLDVSPRSPHPPTESRGGSGGALLFLLLLGAAVASGVYFFRDAEQSEQTTKKLKSWADTAAGAAERLKAAATAASEAMGEPGAEPSLADSPSGAPAAETSAGPEDSTRDTAQANLVCPEAMVAIQSVTFEQGSNANAARDDEKPAHSVALGGYCIDRYEVTVKDYAACVARRRCKPASTKVYWPKITPSERQSFRNECSYRKKGLENHPINCVSWNLADTYCKALGKRLPTEAEWEHAARGPTPHIYPWGDEEPTGEHLNACDKQCQTWGKRERATLSSLHDGDDGFATLAPVGKYPRGRSRFGPHDMAGNVWEWVSDWYGAYSSTPSVDPSGPATGTTKVVRGGGWDTSYASRLRPSFRDNRSPSMLSHAIGFRCAKTPAADEPSQPPE